MTGNQQLVPESSVQQSTTSLILSTFHFFEYFWKNDAGFIPDEHVTYIVTGRLGQIDNGQEGTVVFGVKWHEGEDRFLLDVGAEKIDFKVRSKGVILASGRFLGKGLHAERKQIRETVFDLPVYQPWDRAQWHRKEFLDPKGHPINRAGLEVDHLFRPLSRSGDRAFRMLFAAGSILAHQDWMRMKCGSGLAIATAYGAVNAFIKLKGMP